jgi:hypothetical protein
MRLLDRYDGRATAFEGDRSIVLRSLPANARVSKAKVTLTPVTAPGGGLFEEVIRFSGDQGEWGATKNHGTGFVEVDFHARRTLTVVRGTSLDGANLQVDVGGLYVEINDKGAIRTPGDTLFSFDGRLPGLTVIKFRLTKSGASGARPPNLDVSSATVHSVPANISLRLGQLPPFWSRAGELTAAEASPDFAEVLQAFLPQAATQGGYAVVPLVLHSDTLARLSVELEIEYFEEQKVLPEGLNETVLPFGLSGQPVTKNGTAELRLPVGARVVPRHTTARVVGAFEETRVVDGPRTFAEPKHFVELSPAVMQAQPLAIAKKAVAARAVDLLMTPVDQTVRMQLDLRENLDGKPADRSLLSAPVAFELSRKTAGQPIWVSVALPGEVQFRELGKTAGWIVVQSLDGQAKWSVTLAAEDRPPMQRSRDGGLSWRETSVAGLEGRPGAIFRLRYRPDRFEMPIELRVGADGDAERVKLERFEGLGRVDFNLDFDEAAQAINRYLDRKVAAACSQAELVANGAFEEWLRVGDKVGEPLPFDIKAEPVAITTAPDRPWAYVAARNDKQKNLFLIFDVACRQFLPGASTPFGEVAVGAMAVSPDGDRLYAATLGFGIATHGQGADVFALPVDLVERAVLHEGRLEAEGQVISLLNTPDDPTAVAISPDGGLLYVTVRKTGSAGSLVILEADTGQLVQSVDVGENPRGLALSPDGTLAFITGDDSLSVVDMRTMQLVGEPISVGKGAAGIAVSPEGKHAFVACEDENSVLVVDLERLAVVGKPITVGKSPHAVSITPAGDAVLVANRRKNQLTLIPVGVRVPAEWTLTSGYVEPFCFPGQQGLVALLGDSKKQKPLPSSISQVVPVSDSCTYEFCFLGAADLEGPVAEVMWLRDCGLVRADRVPVAPRQSGGRREPFLRLHRVRLQAPAGAVQAEIRFLAPAGTALRIDSVSFSATSDRLANGDLRFQEEGLLSGWKQTPQSARGFLVRAEDEGEGVLLRNSGTETVELTQTVPVQADADFSFELRGQSRTAPSAEEQPRVELRWLKQGASLEEDPAVLQLAPNGFETAAITGRTPKQATEAEVHLVLPSRIEQRVKGISLRFPESVSVPLTFVSQAPGQITVSDWRVAYDRRDPTAIPPPRQKLCPPTPPGVQPGEQRHDCCFCPCCEAEVHMKETTEVQTGAERPAVVGRCANCAGTVIRLGGQSVGGVPAVDFPRILVRRPAAWMPFSTERRETGRKVVPEPRAVPPTLVDIVGIGPARALQLEKAGLDSVEKLAAATPRKVARALRRTGVSEANADVFIHKAKELLGSQ